ncbi:MAG: agmatinase [Solirubrobacteraceae bacterium]
MEPFRSDEPSYAGVGVTYCRTPLILDPAELAGADVAILGAPFDEGVSYRPGTRFGPRAIRTAEDVGGPSDRPNMELGIDPFSALRVVDHGDITAVAAALDQSHARLREAVAGILAAGAVPVVLGGDHSLSVPVMQALADAHGPDGYSVIHFDTHADTGAAYHGVVNWHGTPFYRGVDEGFMRGENIVQVGLRGAWPFPDEFQWMRDHGFRWHTMAEIEERGIGPVVQDAIEHAAARAPRTYLTVDIDVLDPAYAPGTGTPEPGGLTTRELLGAVRRIAAAVDLCAMDIVEVSPPYDHADITAMAGHRVVLETLGGLALRRSGQEARPERP